MKVISDAVNREDSYILKTSGVDATGCIQIRDGENDGKISLSISNDINEIYKIKNILEKENFRTKSLKKSRNFCEKNGLMDINRN
mgnify:CR=1 FL=1